MYTYQFLVLLVVFALVIKAPNKGAFYLLIRLLLSFYIVYVDIPAEQYSYYYLVCGTLDLLTGIALQKKYNNPAICSYLLVLANVYGYGTWYAYISPVSYDIICSILIILQLIGILPRAIHDGIRRVLDEFSVAKSTFFNSYKTYAKMYKNTSTKKTHR